jgi:hypothetical protein
MNISFSTNPQKNYINNTTVVIFPVEPTRGSHGRDCMVVGFIISYAISAYHH